MRTVISYLALLLFCLAQPLFAQEEPFHLINTGYGGRALGMAGAFISEADDLSALYWNPAGLAQLKRLHARIDYLHLSGNDDFALASHYGGMRSENYSVSGNSLQSVSAAYGWEHGLTSFAVAFGWQRTSLLGSSYDPKGPTMVTEIGPYSAGTYEYEFHRKFSGGEDEFALAFSAKPAKSTFFGLSWNTLSGNPGRQTNNHFTSNGTRLFDDQKESFVSDSTLSESENLRGNYWKAAVLTHIGERFSLGAYVRFPYTRKGSRIQDYTTTITSAGSAPQSYTSHITDQREVKIPTEYSVGASFHLTRSFLVDGSLTAAAWANTCYTESDGYCRTPFPTERYYADQSALVQWRFGAEFRPVPKVAMRAGYLIDAQPYRNSTYYTDTDRGDAVFHGFSFGFGYRIAKASFDIAFLRETGSVFFVQPVGGITDRDVLVSNAQFRQNRLYFGFELAPF